MSIFKNRVALITGASGEIGKELAIELNKKGASIILAGRRREVLNNIGKNLEGDVKIIDESIDNFSNFEKKSGVSPKLRPNNIRDISFAGYGRDFNVDLHIKEISFGM